MKGTLRENLMKRSEINAIVRDAAAFFRQHQFYLPPFAHWTPDEWRTKGAEVQEVVTLGLGWDVFVGKGKFDEVGLLLFTLRNGLPANLKHGKGVVYAEKIMISRVDQVTPLHFHWHKTEDIINRGGGKLMIQLYNATPDEAGLQDTPVTVRVNGMLRTVEAGGIVALSPGESITLEPFCYHKFWAAEATVLIGEVSTVNDDHTDNRFYEPLPRFPEVEEDEPPEVVLVNEYGKYVQV
jgi:D-lyxose ketol-isomerase